MSGTNRVFYWDTCVYYAWLKQEAAYGDFLSGLDDMVLRSRENKIVIITSTITLLEVLDTGLKPEAELTFRKLFEHDIHKAIDVDILVALKAREYRSHYKRKGEAYPGIPDSLHMATAFINGADEMHTFDDGKKGPGKEKFSPLGHSGNIAGDALTIVRPPKLAPPAPPPPPIPTTPLLPGVT